MAASATASTKLIRAIVGLLLVLWSGWPPALQGPPAPGFSAHCQVIKLRRPMFRPDRVQALLEDDNEPRAGSAPPASNGPGGGKAPVPLPAPVPLDSLDPPPPPPPPGTRPTSRPANQQARPGNVIVRLGADQEIDRIEYMLRDGQIATVYTRPSAPDTAHRPAHTNEKRQDAPYTQALGDASLQQQQQPLVLAPFQGQPIQAQAPSVVTIDFQDNEQLDQGQDPAELMAHLSSTAGALALQKAPGKVKGFVAKIKGKLKKLPKAIQKKLQAKSTLGKMFFDGAVRVPKAPGGQANLGSNLLRLPIGPGSLMPLRAQNGANTAQKAQLPLLPLQNIGFGSIVQPPGSPNELRGNLNGNAEVLNPLSHQELRSE